MGGEDESRVTFILPHLPENITQLNQVDGFHLIVRAIFAKAWFECGNKI